MLSTGELPTRGLFFHRGAFAEEYRQLLLSRARIVFLAGLGTSVLLILAAEFIGAASNNIVTEFVLFNLELALNAFHVGGFALALGFLSIGTPGADRIQWTVFVMVALNAILAPIGVGGMFKPDFPVTVPLSLTLFVPAAFVPWRTRFQIGLGALCVVSFAVIQGLIHVLWPALQGSWEATGFWASLATTTIAIAILAATSVLVTHTLYRLRRSAAKARQMGSYELAAEIGRGGMGKVYRAEHAMMCRPAAVKVLRASTAEADGALARFEREVQLSSTLSHPNTITIFDFGRAADQSFYYAMEYLDGLDLEEFVSKYGPMPPERVVHIMRQICGSLAEAHDRGIVHRDLKPANVFLTKLGGIPDFVKVLDFGIAREIRDDTPSTITRTGTVMGTPTYMAPEAISGDRPVDGRADIYCLGLVCYRLLTGAPPFSDKSAMAVMANHLMTEPSRPSELSEEEIPRSLEKIILRCLEKRPKDRFGAAAEIEMELDAVSCEQPWTTDRAAEWWDLHRPCEEASEESSRDAGAPA